MAGYKTQQILKTLSGTSAQTIVEASDAHVWVPTGAVIAADSGDTVYIGGSDVSTSNGFLLPTAPSHVKLGDVFGGGCHEMIDLSQCYVVGGDGDKVRVLFLKNK